MQNPSRAQGRARITVSLTAAATAVAATLVAAPAAFADAPQPRIVGGEPTTTDAYPFITQITDTNGFQFCGGTLVAPNKVVTAAHCLQGERPATIEVVGGRTNIDGTDGTVSAVTGIWRHPEYDRVNFVNDVAVLTLADAMPYDTLPIAQAADSGLYEEGTLTRILGWGATSSNGSYPNQLRTAEVPVVSDESCAAAYDPGFDADAHVCAGYEEGGVDTCQGDSGGPLVIEGRLAGITSFGNGCAEPGWPGVYTQVNTYADLLTEQINS
ncbi:serine protease [Streptomyces sp. B6B3]|uniref:S1 family peptidase n=1 Tax=Streptomyces sp. B6B3 TaxID=3153570 RepID=UPI00325DFCC4